MHITKHHNFYLTHHKSYTNKIQEMKFSELKDFLENKMRLSHIYQPLLVKTLLNSGGKATIRQLAVSFLNDDEGLIADYEKRLKQMPIKVLSKHGIILKDGDIIKLNSEKLSLEQKAEIKLICERKMQEYIKSRGIHIWDYRLLDLPVSDNLRYQILKEANSRCSLCGATRDNVPLDVDHIIPLSKGGKTEYENLQVLCAKCNRTKRNRDKTDFRKLREDYDPHCKFCRKIKSKDVLMVNELAFAINDIYPVTNGHTLIMPKRHVKDYFQTTEAERVYMDEILRVVKKQLQSADASIMGFNIGINVGEVAGQSIEHCHIHLIPRRKGDCSKPKGGVRGVIPDKMSY